ncbi:MAG: ACT domain-containing protein, partial [Armatimonadetes bacterium]|nr:ACT domain-containing protein [Armatimonadota bacterium]
ALLHDVGRSETEEGHAEAGAKAAEQVCDRWGVYETTKETVCWLVREHLTLDRTVRMRDVTHPDTAAELARIVGTPERLALLTLLTWADVNAVSAHAWTAAQETFMRELYDRTLAVLGSDEEPAPDASVSRKRLAVQAEGEDIPPEEYEAFLDSMPAHYLLSTGAALAHVHFGLVERAKGGEVSVTLHDVPELSGTDVTVCCPDEPGLLSRILGVLYAYDVSIIGIRASTSKGDTPVALDTITATFGGRPVPRATAARLAAALNGVLAGERDVDELMRSAGKDPERRQQVFTYQYIDGQPGIIEVQAPRGRGMAYRLSRQLAAHGINIVGARVGQWAGSGTAAFYVLGSGNEKLSSEQVGLALEPQKV